MATAKEEIRRMLDSLPDDVSWEDLQYSIYVRERSNAAYEKHARRISLIRTRLRSA